MEEEQMSRIIIQLMGLFFLFNSTYAKDIDVYLKFDETALTQSITAFNSYLADKNIFTKYQIHPFLEQHPLHITLYLAAFTDDKLPIIQKYIAKIAMHSSPISVKANKIFLTASNYVMLDIESDELKEGINPALQHLSDHVTVKLNPLRNPNAQIPDWVQSIPAKRKAFQRYGSPNVFFEYDPHFSLMAKVFTDKRQEQQFQQEMTQLITEYRFIPITIQPVSIGIGYVNSFGQITEELANYPLARV